MLIRLLHNPTLAWAVLMLITLTSWGVMENNTAAVAIPLILLSALKVAIIGFSFMEVQRSKPVFYSFFIVWIATVGAAFMGFTVLSS